MVVKKGAAYLMQEEYKVVDGSIRTGRLKEKREENIVK